jgi:hypothetical protein
MNQRVMRSLLIVLLSPLAFPVQAALARRPSFTGRYNTSWGAVVLTQSGQDVTGSSRLMSSTSAICWLVRPSSSLRITAERYSPRREGVGRVALEGVGGHRSRRGPAQARLAHLPREHPEPIGVYQEYGQL